MRLCREISVDSPKIMFSKELSENGDCPKSFSGKKKAFLLVEIEVRQFSVCRIGFQFDEP